MEIGEGKQRERETESGVERGIRENIKKGKREVWKLCFAWKLCKHSSNSVCCRVFPESMELPLHDFHIMWIVCVCVYSYLFIYRLCLW